MNLSSEDVTRDRLARVGIGAWTIVGVVIVGWGVLWLLGRISSALVPFIMAGIVVLLLRTPVARLRRRGMSRAAAVAVCYLVGIGVLTILGSFVFPAVGAQIAEFLDKFPTYYASAQDFWVQMQNQFSAIVIPTWAEQAITDVSASITAQFSVWSKSLASGVVTAGGAAASFVFNIVFALVIAFWALKDLPAMREELIGLFGERRRAEVEMIVATVLRVLGGYIRGQGIISLVTGLLTTIGLAVLGVPYALVLGLITGVLNVIPYVGAVVAGLIAAIVGAFQGPWVALAAIGVAVAAQQVTDLFITPRVMSEQVDLHPVLVIFSLLVGGSLMGFWGLIVAIPIAAIVKGLFVYYFEKHTQRALGSEQGALFRKKPLPYAGECPPCDAPATDSDDRHAEESD